MRAVGYSALNTSRLYPPGNTPSTHICYRPSRPQDHSAAGRILSMKNSNDTSGNQTRDLPAGSAVPQPTALVYAPTSRYHYVSPIFTTGLLVDVSAPLPQFFPRVLIFPWNPHFVPNSRLKIFVPGGWGWGGGILGLFYVPYTQRRRNYKANCITEAGDKQSG